MKHQIINKKNSYEYLNIISEMLDEALNNLSPESFARLLDNVRGLLEESFARLLDNVRGLLEDYEDGDES